MSCVMRRWRMRHPPSVRRKGVVVVPGLDGLDGALGAEGAGGPPALGLPVSDDVERDELGFDAGLVAVAVDGDQVVVGGVVAPAQGRGRRHGRGHGRCDLLSSGEGPQLLHPIGPAVVDLDDCVRGGGVRLGRPADQITLGEIYRSSIGDKPLWAPRPEGPRECLVTNHSAEYFAKLTTETESAVLCALAGRTLADSLAELRAIDRAGGAPASELPFPAPRH